MDIQIDINELIRQILNMSLNDFIVVGLAIFVFASCFVWAIELPSRLKH